ncbi:hypothetical protein GCM10009839_74220 [Catenulispora yoronensis]|uniref:Multicopper oxidase n=1 Tax=Catenulispora yoronensis TaxID=450799 RepID=A0ABP5GRD3_9ACTN
MGLVSGQVFRDPPDAEVEDGIDRALTITLDTADMRYELGPGKWAWGQAYDGSYTVPTLRVLPGAQVTVRLVNNLAVATKVRFHGLRLASAPSDSTPMCVAAGTTMTYQMAIPDDHPLGTYWYHTHVLTTPCPAASGQDQSGAEGDNKVYAGLSGALIVGDDRTLLPPAYRGIAAHTFVLQDPAAATSGAPAPEDCLVNGELRPVLAMRPNETQLWRLVNATMGVSYQLRLDNSSFTVVGEDGAPVKTVTTADTLLLRPGKRYDVLVTAGGWPGDAWLRTTALGKGADPDDDQYSNTLLVRLAVFGMSVRRLPPLGSQ